MTYSRMEGSRRPVSERSAVGAEEVAELRHRARELAVHLLDVGIHGRQQEGDPADLRLEDHQAQLDELCLSLVKPEE